MRCVRLLPSMGACKLESKLFVQLQSHIARHLRTMIGLRDRMLHAS